MMRANFIKGQLGRYLLTPALAMVIWLSNGCAHAQSTASAADTDAAAQETSARKPSARAKVGRVEMLHFDQMVTLPPGDPRRVSLPWLENGTLIQIQLDVPEESGSGTKQTIQVEVLRPQRAEAPNEKAARGTPMESVLRTEWRGPVADTPRTTTSPATSGARDETQARRRDVIRYRAVREGRYVVVLRENSKARQDAKVRLRVTIDRPIVPRLTIAPPKTLPDDTRFAVAVFSFGLLWTTLLLCGWPIIRAFRSEKRHSEQFWYE